MKVDDFKILFIHGYTASSQHDFYPPLSRELDILHVDYVIPNLPGDKSPHAEEWLTILHEAIKNNTKPLAVVGHSLGTRAALLLIERYSIQVEYLFLIAAFANRVENAIRKGGNAYPDFFVHKINIFNVNSCINKAYVLHSEDDQSIMFEQGKEIAADLKAELIPSHDRDHFSEPINAPYILEVLRQKIGF